MYLMIPDVFYVPVRYDKKNALNIKKTVMPQECNFHNSFINKSTKRKEIIIGVSLPNQREVRWIRDKEGMEARAKEKGSTLMIEYSDFDIAKQTSQVERLISQGIDVLILVPAAEVNSSSLIEKVHASGIKVISYDVLAQNSDVDLYMTHSHKRVGQIQGLYLITKVPKGNYIIMSGDPDGVFKEGAMEYIQPFVNIRNIKIVNDKSIEGWDPKIAYNIVKESLIANENQIDAILAPNDKTAGAAIEALQEQGLAGKVAITGQDADLDAIRRIIDGTQSMTVLKDTRKLGSAAIDSAIKLAQKKPIDITTYINNGKIEVPTVFLEPVLVDKNNINTVIIDSGFYTTKEVYGRIHHQ